MKNIWLLLILLCFSAKASQDQVGIVSQTEFTATVTSARALSNNPQRKYLIIQNKGSTSIYVKYGTAHSGTEGIVVGAGGNYEPFVCPRDAVYIESASSTDVVTLIEGM